MSDANQQPRLAAERLRFAYDAIGPTVLADLSAAIPPGRITALIGANGSGKSTLLKMLGRQLSPDDGQVLLDGKNIAQLPRQTMAASIGVLFQENIAPQGLTVEELVAYGRFPYRRLFESQTPEDVNAIEAALERTGLMELRHRPLESLSGGQKQLAWIALALAQTTRILLLDEPTTFLDLKHQAEVMHVVEALRDDASLTIIMVLHDVNQAARHADHLIAMRDGRIIASGNPAAVITPQLLRDIYGVNAEVLTASDGLPVCVVRGL
ncbi:MAG: ABC transporter ATP-binding protein [Tepidisphaeraceae bacterium]